MWLPLRFIPLLVFYCSASFASVDDLDCPRGLENEARYSALTKAIAQVESFSAQGVITRTLNFTVGRKTYAELIAQLKALGVETERSGNRLRFLPGDGHQIGRTAKWLAERNIDFYWDPSVKNYAAAVTFKGARSFWDLSIRNVEMSSRSLESFIRQHHRTSHLIRHELAHIQAWYNREKGTESLFHGAVQFTTIPQYEKFYMLDEVPAEFESFKAIYDELKRWGTTPPPVESIYPLVDHYRSLYNQSRYLEGFYRRVRQLVQNTPFGKLAIVNDSHGVYFQNQSFDTDNEIFSFSLSTHYKGIVTPEWVLEEIEKRSRFFRELTDTLHSLKSRPSQKLELGVLTRRPVRLNAWEYQEFAQDVLERLPALQALMESAWVVKPIKRSQNQR